jgi:hypothetical protein
MTDAPARHVGRPVPRNRSICHRGQVHLSSMTDAPARHVGRPVPRNRSICHRGQAHLSCMTDASARRVGRPVLRNRSICHRGQVHLSRVRLRVSPHTGALVTRAAAGVLAYRCTCHACRCGCRLTWSRASGNATAVGLVAGARVWRSTCGRRRARLRASARRYRLRAGRAQAPGVPSGPPRWAAPRAKSAWPSEPSKSTCRRRKVAGRG